MSRKEHEDTVRGHFAKLPLPTKIAAVTFVIAKVHGFVGVVAMFANRPLAAVLLTIAGVSLVITLVLAGYQLTWGSRARTLEEQKAFHLAEAARLEALLKE